MSGVEKAKAYMESVVYFMRHGDALEVGVAFIASSLCHKYIIINAV